MVEAQPSSRCRNLRHILRSLLCFHPLTGAASTSLIPLSLVPFFLYLLWPLQSGVTLRVLT